MPAIGPVLLALLIVGALGQDDAPAAASPLVGGDWGTPYALECPAGSFVTTLTVRAAAWLDALSIGCSDGSSQGPIGGPGGYLERQSCSSGYTRLRIGHKTYITSIEPFCNGRSQGAMGGQPDAVEAFACPAGTKLVGVRGKTKALVTSLQLLCASSTTKASKAGAGAAGPEPLDAANPFLYNAPPASQQQQQQRQQPLEPDVFALLRGEGAAAAAAQAAAASLAAPPAPVPPPSPSPSSLTAALERMGLKGLFVGEEADITGDYVDNVACHMSDLFKLMKAGAPTEQLLDSFHCVVNRAADPWSGGAWSSLGGAGTGTGTGTDRLPALLTAVLGDLARLEGAAQHLNDTLARQLAAIDVFDREMDEANADAFADPARAQAIWVGEQREVAELVDAALLVLDHVDSNAAALDADLSELVTRLSGLGGSADCPVTSAVEGTAKALLIGHLARLCADCMSSPCANGGRCVQEAEGYSCVCAPGWGGNDCTSWLKSCEGTPCQNGGSCVGSPDGSFVCHCAEGWTGKRCQHGTRECAKRPCQHGAECRDTDEGYQCLCRNGFEGKNCEIDTDDCADQPCKNGAICIDKVAAFQCKCAEGYAGQTCEIDVDDCAPNPCMNGATCIDGVNSYKCMCAPGWEGERCTENIDDCINAPCLNGATCVDGVNSFTCSCKAGWEGEHCEQNIDECLPKPCKNGGSCVDGIASYTCHCPRGYEGRDCEVNRDDCNPNPCKNGALCIDGVDAYECQCAAGFSGRDCSTNIDDCTPTSCLNGGTCIDGINSFSCSCKRGFSGERCEITYGSAKTSAGRSCSDIFKQHEGQQKLPSGSYWIKVNNKTSLVYCDMESTVGGTGWTRVINIKAGTADHLNPGEVLPGGAEGSRSFVDSGKLSDEDINAIPRTVPYFFFECGGYHAWVRNDANKWSSLANSNEAAWQWQADPGLDGTFECDATKPDAVFSAESATCPSGAAYSQPGAMGGCYWDGFPRNGAVWVK